MFSQVIAGVDGKENGRDAAVLASKLLVPDGQLTLVHVYTDESGFRDSGVNFSEIVRQDCLELLEREQAATGLDTQLEVVGASSVEHYHRECYDTTRDDGPTQTEAHIQR
jgi:hypothetical protein